jgi:transposase
MQQRNTGSEVVVAANEARLTIGLDLADSFTQICIVDAAGTVIAEERVRTTTSDFQRRFSGLPRTRVVLEVGTHSPWVSRLLTQLGHEVIVANARRVRLIGHSHRKNDRTDAAQLARLGRMDPSLLAPIHHRGIEAHEALAVVRGRDALIRSRTQLVNHVRGAVKAWGARLPRTTAHAFHHKVSAHIPEPLRPALQPLLEVIGELTTRIGAADREVRRHWCRRNSALTPTTTPCRERGDCDVILGPHRGRASAGSAP